MRHGSANDDAGNDVRPRYDVRLGDHDRLDWLRLIRNKHVGPYTFRVLVSRYGSARGGAGGPVRIYTQETAAAEKKAARARGIDFIALGEPAYPPRFARDVGSAGYAVISRLGSGIEPMHTGSVSPPARSPYSPAVMNASILPSTSICSRRFSNTVLPSRKCG